MGITANTNSNKKDTEGVSINDKVQHNPLSFIKFAKDTATDEVKKDELIASRQTESLNAKFKDPINSNPSIDSLLEINVNEIEFHPNNVSIYGKKINPELIKAIIEDDVTDPIVVCKGENKKFRVLSGHTRVRIKLDPDIQEQIKNTHGEYRYLIKAYYVGVVDENLQKRRLIDSNLHRDKTLLQKFKECEIEKEILKVEAEQRARVGKRATDAIGRIDQYLAQKYFGSANKFLAQLRKIVEILSEDTSVDIEDHPIIVKINKGELKVKPVYEKLISNKPADKKNERITKGVTDAAMDEFIPKFKTNDYRIDDLSRTEMPLAYKYLINQARIIKEAFDALD